jgi:aryl-alcohol dehydrogenase-like predicted oxidoreductase
MEHRMLGRTGVSVSKLCLGAMMFGAWGESDHQESIRIIHAALAAGINFIDTADVYSAGESEEIVGKALAGGKRDDVVLATKVGFPMGEDPGRRGASRRRIIRGVEASLRRLNTDWIDLYQIHRPDPNTDIDETLGALSDLVHHGKIRFFGHSTFPASEITEAQWTAERRGRERFRCEQPPYSILTRAIEHDVLPTCQRYGVGVIPYSPLAGGWLSGRYRKDADTQGPASSRARLPASTSPIPRTSASSTPSSSSPSSPRRPERRWSSSRSRSCSTTQLSPRPSSDRARSSTSSPSSPLPTSPSPTKYSTASTPSTRLASRSTTSTTAGPSRRSDPPHAGAEVITQHTAAAGPAARTAKEHHGIPDPQHWRRDARAWSRSLPDAAG